MKRRGNKKGIMVPNGPKKGEVRNPKGINGHTKVMAMLRQVFEEIGEEKVPIDKDGNQMERAKILVRKCYQYAIEGNPAFANMVFSYGWGKPTEHVETTGKDGAALVLPSFTEWVKAVHAKDEDQNK